MKTTLRELRELVNDSYGLHSDECEVLIKDTVTGEYKPLDIYAIQIKKP